MGRIALICLIVIIQWLCIQECSSSSRHERLQGKNLGKFIVTYYDNCELCCGKDESHPAYGITASGESTRRGYVACNWLPFGAVVEIEGLGYFTVKDRGAKRLFGTRQNPVKRIDVWVPSHAEARKRGKQIRLVVLLTTP